MMRPRHTIHLGDTSDVPTENPAFQKAQSERLDAFLTSLRSCAEEHKVQYSHKVEHKLESIEITLTYHEGNVSNDFRTAISKRWPEITVEWDAITLCEVIHLPCVMYRSSWLCLMSNAILLLAFFSIMVVCLYIQCLNKPDRYRFLHLVLDPTPYDPVLS